MQLVPTHSEVSEVRADHESGSAPTKARLLMLMAVTVLSELAQVTPCQVPSQWQLASSQLVSTLPVSIVARASKSSAFSVGRGGWGGEGLVKRMCDASGTACVRVCVGGVEQWVACRSGGRKEWDVP